jgi:hypothetical protein
VVKYSICIDPYVSREAKQHAEAELKGRGVDLKAYEAEIRDL